MEQRRVVVTGLGALCGIGNTAAEVWDELSPHEYGVLYALSKAPQGLRITDLSRDVLLTQPGLSRLIAGLETRGLVERVEHPGDGRRWPQIPAPLLVWAQLLGFVLRETSFHALEALVRSPARRALAVARGFSEDAL